MRARALSHAELCIGCAARLAEERAWLANVRVVKTELARQEAPARVKAALLAALRNQHRSAPPPVISSWLSWRWAAVAATLFVILGLAGLVAMKLGGKEQPQEALRLPAPLTTPPVPAAMEKVTPAPTPVPVAMRRALRPVHLVARLPLRSSAAPPSETPAPFYSLVEDGQMAPLESGRIVRIEVPPAALIKWGVPLTETTLTQPMQADLLLGQDGLARAIRFVPNSQSTRTQ